MFGQEIKETGSPEEKRFNCPFCPTVLGKQDSKFHLYANFKKQTFICFRCSTTGTLNKLKKFLNIGGSFNTPVVQNLGYIKDRASLLFTIKKNPPIELDLVSVPIMSGKAPMAHHYMRERGFSDEELKKYDIRAGITFVDASTKKVVKRWAGRIIFPFYEDGEIIYMIGRAYGNQEPKYINSMGNKDRILYGIDEVNGECILCEGVISAIAAQRVTGMPAVAMLGKTISKYQLAKLRFKTNTVYVCLDGTEDVTQQFRNKVNRNLIQAGFKVYEIKLPTGFDPDELKGDFVRYFNQAKNIII